MKRSIMLAASAAAIFAFAEAPANAALTQNALTANALTQNALTQNALTQNALTANALTQNGLHLNGLTPAGTVDQLNGVTVEAITVPTR